MFPCLMFPCLMFPCLMFPGGTGVMSREAFNLLGQSFGTVFWDSNKGQRNPDTSESSG
jgi:hypothetical protein